MEVLPLVSYLSDPALSRTAGVEEGECLALSAEAREQNRPRAEVVKSN